MQPDVSVFQNLDEGFRGMAWDGREYVLGANTERVGIVANLPPGEWTVDQYDIVDKSLKRLSNNARGKFKFDSPNSRAVLFHFKRNDY
jgi:hypothetical protein